MDREVCEQQHIPVLRQSHGPIASSIPLRAAALLLGGNASDPEAQSLGACPSRGKFTSRITRHGQSDDPRANVSSVGHLVHHESDELCCWKPGRLQLDRCCSKYTYIMNESSAYKGHFGPFDHGYAH